MAYQAILFSTDGEDYQLDYTGDTVGRVWENVNDGGSRWFFYPIVFVIKDYWRKGWHPSPMRQRVVDTPHGLEYLRGKTIKTVQAQLKHMSQQELEFILGW